MPQRPICSDRRVPSQKHHRVGVVASERAVDRPEEGDDVSNERRSTLPLNPHDSVPGGGNALGAKYRGTHAQKQCQACSASNRHIGARGRNGARRTLTTRALRAGLDSELESESEELVSSSDADKLAAGPARGGDHSGATRNDVKSLSTWRFGPRDACRRKRVMVSDDTAGRVTRRNSAW